MALASPLLQRNIIIADLTDLKLSISFGIMTFNLANCSWEELSMHNIAALSGKACDNPQQSYISAKDWQDGNAFFAYCNNNNEIEIK